jgi:outer membrane protein OmpA-like peptidoglycan-associated protein
MHKSPNQQRWLLPYADLLTVLFIVLLTVNPTQTPQQAPTPQPVNATVKITKTPQAPAQLDTTATLSPALLAEAKRLKLTIIQPSPRSVAFVLPQAVLFASNTYQVSPAGITQLMQLKPVLHRVNGRIQVEGHSDNQPGNGGFSNRQLSALRAASVADVLTGQLHLDPAHVTAVGFADSDPIMSNNTADGRQHNRRVLLHLLPVPITQTRQPDKIGSPVH